jgi:indolepyruvate decarboxylase
MDKKYTVGQYLVDRLSQLGLGHLFSIAGDYSIEWLSNYVEPSNIKLIEEVNELNAGFAADGYARLKGIGALCATYSAGALSAVNAIAGAYSEKVPIVLINGTPSVKKTLTFEQTGFIAHHFIGSRETDLQVFQYITTATARLDNPDLAPMLIDYVLTQCITEKQPVYIELLQDVVELECAPPSGTLKPARSISDSDSLSQSIAAIKTKLESASQPLIWIGAEVDRFNLQAETEALIKQLNIPYVTELLSKTVLSENDDQFVGVFDGQGSSAVVLDLVEKSDFILCLGVWLTDINSLGWNPEYNKMAFASFDTIKLGTDFYPQVSLDDLINGLLAQQVKCKEGTIPCKTENQVPAINKNDAITYQGFYDFIQPYVNEKTILGSDPSLNYFGSILIKTSAAKGFIVQSSYSAIGYIGPAATGISLAKQDDQRVMVFSGDGGFQMCAQCLSTQTRFKLNPIIFVINNGVYAVEQWLSGADVFHSDKPFFTSCLLHPWNYSKLSEVFGCMGWKATTYNELQIAVEAALANTSSPTIIDVVVPSKSIPDNANWKKE